MRPLTLDPDRLLPAEPSTRAVAKRLYARVRDLPIDRVGEAGYLEAHCIRRRVFRDMGGASTDHGHPTAQTANLPTLDVLDLFRNVLIGNPTPAEAELFRGQMLTGMARLVTDHRLDEDEAVETAADLAYNLPKRAYKLDQPAASCPPERV